MIDVSFQDVIVRQCFNASITTKKVDDGNKSLLQDIIISLFRKNDKSEEAFFSVKNAYSAIKCNIPIKTDLKKAVFKNMNFATGFDL